MYEAVTAFDSTMISAASAHSLDSSASQRTKTLLNTASCNTDWGNKGKATYCSSTLGPQPDSSSNGQWLSEQRLAVLSSQASKWPELWHNIRLFWSRQNQYCVVHSKGHSLPFRALTLLAERQERHHVCQKNVKLECGPMPNVMAALPNIGGALCSMPQSLADAQY